MVLLFILYALAAGTSRYDEFISKAFIPQNNT